MTWDITGYVSRYVNEYRPYLIQYRLPILGILALPLLNEAYQDYCAWYDLGAGGIPHNLYGWAFQCFLRIFSSSDTRSTGCYDNVGDLELDARSFLDGPLPEREGERPEVAPFVAPHRQVSDTASEEIKDVFKSFIFLSQQDAD
jgi:hypothetical protein